jgi:MoxR-like ATPase
MIFITSTLYPEIDRDMATKMIAFNERLYDETMIKGSFGKNGKPWEFNLRDILRWMEIIKQSKSAHPGDFLNILYAARLRTQEDQSAVWSLFQEVFQIADSNARFAQTSLFASTTSVTFGHASLVRDDRMPRARLQSKLHKDLVILQCQRPILEALAKCVEMKWGALLTGPAGCGKTFIIRLFALLAGQSLEEFSMNPDVDTTELLGGFEQVDVNRKLESLKVLSVESLEVCIQCLIGDSSFNVSKVDVKQLFDHLQVLHVAGRVTASSIHLALSTTLEVVSRYAHDWDALFDQTGATHPSKIKQQLADLETVNGQGNFEWVDGLLLRAVKEGKWILLDNVNLCPSSVLDRLNSLLETGGFLMVNERGLVDGEVQIVYPHHNFRLFMTLNPSYGEISRAMRNRVMEIAVLNSRKPSSQPVYGGEDLRKLLYNGGVALDALCIEIENIWINTSDSSNIRDLVKMARAWPCSNASTVVTQNSTPAISALPQPLASIPFNYYLETNLDNLSSLSAIKPDALINFLWRDLFWQEPQFSAAMQDSSCVITVLVGDKDSFTLAREAFSGDYPSKSVMLYTALVDFVSSASRSNAFIKKLWLQHVLSLFSGFLTNDQKQTMNFAMKLLSQIITGDSPILSWLKIKRDDTDLTNRVDFANLVRSL